MGLTSREVFRSGCLLMHEVFSVIDGIAIQGSVTKVIWNSEMLIVVEFRVETNGVSLPFGVGVKRPWQDHICSESNEQGSNCGVKPHKCFETGLELIKKCQRVSLQLTEVVMDRLMISRRSGGRIKSRP